MDHHHHQNKLVSIGRTWNLAISKVVKMLSVQGKQSMAGRVNVQNLFLLFFFIFLHLVQLSVSPALLKTSLSNFHVPFAQ